MKTSIKILLLVSILTAGSEGAQDVFGTIGGATKPLVMTDSQGTQVTFTLKGGGYGEVIGGPDFDEINLHETTNKSNFFIKTASGRETSVGDIKVEGDLKSLVGKKVDLRGNITIKGTVAKLELDDVKDDHTIIIESPGDGKAGVSIKFDEVRDLSIDSNTPIKSLMVTEWIDSGGGSANEITAPSIDAMRVKGDKRRGLVGDFDADLLLTGATDASKPTLKNGKIAGALTNSLVVEGDAGNLTMGQLLGYLEVNGDAKNIKTTDPLAITPDDPPLGELYVGGSACIACCKDRIRASDCTLYSRSEPQLYPMADLCAYYDEGSFWRYLARYTIVMYGRKQSGQEQIELTVTDVSGDCVEVSSTIADQEISYRWCTSGKSMYITGWNIGVEDMDMTMNIDNTVVAPEALQVKQTYRDTGNFDGTFSVYSSLIGTINGNMSGTATATARLIGHEQVETQVDGGTTYMAAKVQEVLTLKGVMTFQYSGRTFRMGFSALEDAYMWGVPGVGIVKEQVRNMKVRVSVGIFSSTVSCKEWVDLIDYGPR